MNLLVVDMLIYTPGIKKLSGCHASKEFKQLNCLLASVTSYLQRAPDVTVFGDDREKFNVFAYYCQAGELYIFI